MKIKILVVVGCLLLVGSLTGCGERSESSTYYYSPSFTKAGNIIFIKGLQSTTKDMIGSQIGSSYTESLMQMSAAGASETLLFDVTGAPPYSMTCSPTGEYVAYGDELRNNLFNKIVIRNISTSMHSGLDRSELVFPDGVVSFDWSNDGLRIVYCTTAEVRTVKVDGSADTLVVAATDLTAVAWKYGTRIAFTHNLILSLVNSDGSGQVDLSAAASVDKAQISPANTNEVYGISGSSLCSVEVSAGTPATVEVMANFKGDLPRLSADGLKVVYSKTGETTGIYRLDIATKAETKIK